MNTVQKIVFEDADSIWACRTSSMPSADVNMEDIPDLASDAEDDLDDKEPYTGKDSLEEGDQLFMATISGETEFIQATSNVLQQLAKTFHKNSKQKLVYKSVPMHFHDFEDLFSKSSFDHLPDCKVWDHAIELVPYAKASNHKVYPLAPMNNLRWTNSCTEISLEVLFAHSSCPWPLPSSHTGLLGLEHTNNQELISPPSRFGARQPTARCKVFHKA
jgi:hypothetical protein